MEKENWFRFKWLIDNEYHYTFIVDNLPSAYMIRNETTIVKYGEGLPLGYMDNAKYYVYNHLDFLI